MTIESEFFVEVKLWGPVWYTPRRLIKAWDKTIADQVKHLKIMGDESPSALAEPILVYKVTGSRPANKWAVALLDSKFWADLKPHKFYKMTDRVMVVRWEAFADYLDEVYDMEVR